MYKKILSGIILAFIGMLEFQFDASAAQCSFSTCSIAYGGNYPNGYCSESGADNMNPYLDLGCSSISCQYFLYNGSIKIGVCSCSACPGGKVRQDNTSAVKAQIGSFCDNVPTVYTCGGCGCGTYSAGGTATSCTSCPSNTYGGGGDYSSCKTCPTNATCNGGCTFTCKAGYYKNGDTCTQCPLADDVWTNSSLTTKARYTSSAGAASINDCYLPSGTIYYDTKGTFKFSTTCNYE